MPKMYEELASWWPLLSPPADYGEEAAFTGVHSKVPPTGQPGGVALFAPDFVSETFRSGADHGGSDDGMRGLRYLEWAWDPDPSDTTYIVDYAYMLRGPDGAVDVEHDRHVEGLFARADWLRLLIKVGFRTPAVPLEHSEVEPGVCEVFVAAKPLSGSR